MKRIKHWETLCALGMIISIAYSATACSPTAGPQASTEAAPTPIVESTNDVAAAVIPTVAQPESITAAEPTQAAASVTETVQTAATDDPFTYCANVVNVDAPDSSYTGSKMPDAIVKALMKASGASTDMPADVFANGSVWRCMDGKLYACYVGANLPCGDKANTDTAPTQAENDYCKANPGADFIPAAVTGHNTIYSWKCQSTQAATDKQVFNADARGFITEIWYPIAQP
jgi:hypothetical protein